MELDDRISTDVLSRIHGALPKLRHWVDRLLGENASTAKALDTLGFERLSGYFPVTLLQTARVAIVQSIPFPPVDELGLPEFHAMSTMPLGGITFGHMFFALDSQFNESLCFHEMIHVVQWNALGFDDFLLTYGVGILQHGYDQSPLEAIAFAAQALFEARTAIPALIGAVTTHARTERATMSALFAQHGISISP